MSAEVTCPSCGAVHDHPMRACLFCGESLLHLLQEVADDSADDEDVEPVPAVSPKDPFSGGGS